MAVWKSSIILFQILCFAAYGCTPSTAFQAVERPLMVAQRVVPKSRSLVQLDAKVLRPDFFLIHERDFGRQLARLGSLESYVLVSTLTASMSFGALCGFSPIIKIGKDASLLYRALCIAIQVVSGFSTLFGLYSTIIFSLTILYGKSALGTERDPEYDLFMRTTGRARLNGFRCFSLSLALFAVEAVLVLLERVCTHKLLLLPVSFVSSVTMFLLWKDWSHLYRCAGRIIYRVD